MIGLTVYLLYYYGIFPIFTTEGKLAVQALSDINCQRLLQSIRTVNLYQIKMHSTFLKVVLKCNAERNEDKLVVKFF